MTFSFLKSADDLPSASITKPVETVMVVGTTAQFDKYLGSWVCDKVLGNLPTAKTAEGEEPPAKKRKSDATTSVDPSQHLELLQALVENSKPGKLANSGTSSETTLPIGSSFVRVVIGVLPEAVSRHNAPGQTHNYVNILKKGYSPKKVNLLVSLDDDTSHHSAICTAVGRVAGVSYQRKAGKASGVPNESADDVEASILVVFPTANKDAEAHEILCKGMLQTRQLVDAPTNELHTTAFVQKALTVAQTLPNTTAKVISGKDLESQGYGGIYGVGKAAAHPPALVILEYAPPNCAADAESICMVGKGIVYDTGGLSMKTKATMPGMKRDMGGAAAIFSAFCCAAQTGVVKNQKLYAILCLAENAVSPEATRPDDVQTFLSGKTVEINNTDAEGRLVLADGCCHAIQFLKPSILIDMATLTGAQGFATGRHFGAIYANADGLEQLALQAGKETGDLLFPVPYAPEFFRPEFKSAVADMKNSMADRLNAHVSCAGQFINNHIESYAEKWSGQWAHIDMAYPVEDKSTEKATGYGVSLLYSILEKLG